MSHGDSVTAAPAGMRVTASTAGAPVAAFEDDERRLYGVQWHPEVDALGVRPAGAGELPAARRRPRRPTGPRPTSSTTLVAAIREQVGDARVLCALSGGVDSSVAAALVQRAVGDQLTCVFVDHGLLREGEAEQVEKDFVAATGVDLVVVDAREQFLAALAGVSDPEEKRKIIGARVHPRLRAGGARRRGLRRRRGAPGRVPRAGHALPRRRRVRRRRGRGEHQVPPQRRRPAGRPAVQAGRAAALAVQGRGARRSGSSSACPRSSSGGSRSRVRAWASASSAR